MIKQGYGFDILIHNDNPHIRADVVEHCKDAKYLEIALHDESPDVRRTVARRYYGLETLKNDVSKKVRDIARQKLSEMQTQDNNTDNHTNTYTYNSPTIRLANNIDGEEMRRHVEEQAKKFDRELARLEREIDDEDKPKLVVDEWDI